MNARLHGAKPLFAAGVAVTLAIGMLVGGPTANAAGPAPVGLGTAASFAVLAGTTVTNTGATTITGDLGVSPGAAVTGFPPGTVVNGTRHEADAVALQAQSDLTNAYTVAAGLPVTATHGTLGGLTLAGGVYTAGGVVLDLTGTLTLDGQGDPSSVWVFQATSSLITASSSSVALINGASPCNVFWQVTSSATLGSNSTFVGTIMALTSITMATGVTVNGRALARNGAVTLIDDTITNTCSASPSPSPSPSASASPGASASPAASVSPAASASPTPPPTDTLATTPGPGSGPTLLVFVGILFLALVVAVASPRSRRAIRARRITSS